MSLGTDSSQWMFAFWSFCLSSFTSTLAYAITEPQNLRRLKTVAIVDKIVFLVLRILFSGKCVALFLLIYTQNFVW